MQDSFQIHRSNGLHGNYGSLYQGRIIQKPLHLRSLFYKDLVLGVI